MLKLTRWCIAHRRLVVGAWVAAAILATVIAGAVGKPVLTQIQAVHVPGLQMAAGGQVIEQAEGFNIGPATSVGVIAALVILLVTFGSLIAAAMPLVTAGLGLIAGVALIGLATRVTSMSNVAPELALMIGLGVGIDYALFIVTRFRENYLKYGDVAPGLALGHGRGDGGLPRVGSAGIGDHQPGQPPA